jgi:hypothetical protein
MAETTHFGKDEISRRHGQKVVKQIFDELGPKAGLFLYRFFKIQRLMNKEFKLRGIG